MSSLTLQKHTAHLSFEGGIGLSEAKAAVRITGNQDCNWLLVPNRAAIYYVNRSNLQNEQPITSTACIHSIPSAILSGWEIQRERDGKRQRKFLQATQDPLLTCWQNADDRSVNTKGLGCISKHKQQPKPCSLMFHLYTTKTTSADEHEGI